MDWLPYFFINIDTFNVTSALLHVFVFHLIGAIKYTPNISLYSLENLDRITVILCVQLNVYLEFCYIFQLSTGKGLPFVFCV